MSPSTSSGTAAVHASRSRARGQSTSLQRTAVGADEIVVSQVFATADVLIGEHIVDAGNAQWTSVEFDSRALVWWAAVPMPTFTHDGQLVPSVRVRVPDDISAEISDVGSLTFAWRYSETRGQRVANISVRPIVRAEFTRPLSVPEIWEQVLEPVLLLTSLLTRTSDVLTSLHVESAHQEGESSSIRAHIVQSAWLPAVDSNAERPEEMMMSLDEARPNLQQIIDSWLATYHRSRSAIVEFLSPRGAALESAEDDLVRISRCLESFHRNQFGGTFMEEEAYREMRSALRAAVTGPALELLDMRLANGNEPTLKQRLSELIVSCPPPLPEFIGEYDRFASRVVKARNELTHGSATRSTVFNRSEMYWAIQTLTAILTLHLLIQIGCSREDALRRYGRDAELRWLLSTQNSLRYWRQIEGT